MSEGANSVTLKVESLNTDDRPARFIALNMSAVEFSIVTFDRVARMLLADSAGW